MASNAGRARMAGLAESRGGTPRRLLQLVPAAHYAVGLHIDREDIAGRWPEMPDGVTDRAADVWE
ncbi:hypothetical protein ACFWF9_37540, partial [Streptomyces roseolus]